MENNVKNTNMFSKALNMFFFMKCDKILNLLNQVLIFKMITSLILLNNVGNLYFKNVIVFICLKLEKYIQHRSIFNTKRSCLYFLQCVLEFCFNSSSVCKFVFL